jgi:hypothetical protein
MFPNSSHAARLQIQQKIRQLGRRWLTTAPDRPPNQTRLSYMLIGTTTVGVAGGLGYYYYWKNNNTPFWGTKEELIVPLYNEKADANKQVVQGTIADEVAVVKENFQEKGLQNELDDILKIEARVDIPVGTGTADMPNEPSSSLVQDAVIVTPTVIDKEEVASLFGDLLAERVATLTIASSTALSELQRTVNEDVNKINSDVVSHKLILVRLQQHIDTLATQIEQSRLENQQDRQHEQRAFQDMLSMQEKAYHVHLEAALSEARDVAEKKKAV